METLCCSLQRNSSFKRTRDSIRRDQRSVGVSPNKALNPIAQKLPRSLPKLDARNMPTLPQLGRPGGMHLPGGMKNLAAMKPRKLAPLGAPADKGKQLLNAGASRQVVFSA